VIDKVVGPAVMGAAALLPAPGPGIQGQGFFRGLGAGQDPGFIFRGQGPGKAEKPKGVKDRQLVSPGIIGPPQGKDQGPGPFEGGGIKNMLKPAAVPGFQTEPAADQESGDSEKPALLPDYFHRPAGGDGTGSKLYPETAGPPPVDQGGGGAQDKAVSPNYQEDRPQKAQGQFLPQISRKKGRGNDKEEGKTTGAYPEPGQQALSGQGKAGPARFVQGLARGG
jgi:hypothetical protein